MRVPYILTIILAIGCSSQPQLQTGPDAQINENGLVKVDKTVFDTAFVDPNANIKSFRKFYFTPLDFTSIDVIDPEISGTKRSKWEFTPKDALQLEEAYRQGVTRHFSEQNGFQIIEKPEPDSIIVKSRITRFAPSVPKFNSSDRTARSQFYARNSGDLTIATDLYNGQSGALLANLEVNRDMGNNVNIVQITYAQYGLDLRNTFARWARNFSQQLVNLRND